MNAFYVCISITMLRFQDHCNGNWEHNGRIHLETIDNPGWILKIDLNDTGLASKNFQKINDIHRSEQDWMVCKVENAKFETYGGIENLPDILKAFRYCVEDKWFIRRMRTLMHARPQCRQIKKKFIKHCANKT